MALVLKKEFKNTFVAFGKSNQLLGERDDLDELAIMAMESGDPALLNLFGQMPSLAKLKKMKTDRELKAALPKEENQIADPNQQTNEDKIAAAVPEPFNANTKVEELNDKPPSPGK